MKIMKIINIPEHKLYWFTGQPGAGKTTLAHAYAQKISAQILITGVCQTDYSGYPDCRKDFIDLIQVTSNIGSASNIVIETPLY